MKNHKEEYQKEVKRILHIESEMAPQNRWNEITKATKNAAETVLGFKKKQTKNTDPRIQTLSNQQKKLKIDIESSNKKSRRIELRKERNKKLSEIHQILKKIENDKINKKCETIERHPDDSNKMFEVVKELQREKPKISLMINTDEGLTTDENEQVKVITDHFKKQFYKNTNNTQLCEQIEMKRPFSAEEIKKRNK